MNLSLRRPRFLRGPRMEHSVHAPVLHTTRLTLRPWELTDADDLFEMESDPQVTKYLGWPIRDRRESRQHLKHRTKHTQLWQKDDFMALAVYSETAERVIGDVSMHLRDIEPETRTIEMGWFFNPDYRGQGFAQEAVSSFLDFATARVGAKRATARIDAKNRDSVVLATRLGFDLHEHKSENGESNV